MHQAKISYHVVVVFLIELQKVGGLGQNLKASRNKMRDRKRRILGLNEAWDIVHILRDVIDIYLVTLPISKTSLLFIELYRAV